MAAKTRGSGMLWFAVAGGPVAWSIDALAAIAIDHDYCAHGPTGSSAGGIRVALFGLALIAAGVAGFAGLTAWRRLASDGTDTGLGDTDADRRRFMARFGLVISLLTLFGILLRMVTGLVLSPAAC